MITFKENLSLYLKLVDSTCDTKKITSELKEHFTDRESFILNRLLFYIDRSVIYLGYKNDKEVGIINKFYEKYDIQNFTDAEKLLNEIESEPKFKTRVLLDYISLNLKSHISTISPHLFKNSDQSDMFIYSTLFEYNEVENICDLQLSCLEHYYNKIDLKSSYKKPFFTANIQIDASEYNDNMNYKILVQFEDKTISNLVVNINNYKFY